MIEKTHVRLKLIGGPLDGQNKFVRCSVVIGPVNEYSMNVERFHKFNYTVTKKAASPDRMDNIEHKVTFYELATLCTNNNTSFYFLKHESLSQEEALSLLVYGLKDSPIFKQIPREEEV